MSGLNTAAEQLTGYHAAEVVERSLPRQPAKPCRRNRATAVRERLPLLATVQDGQTREALVLLHHRAGHCLPVAGARQPHPALGRARRSSGPWRSCMTTLSYRPINNLLDTGSTGGLDRSFDRHRQPPHAAPSPRPPPRRAPAFYGDSSYAVLLGDVDHFERFNGALRPRHRRPGAPPDRHHLQRLPGPS